MQITMCSNGTCKMRKKCRRFTTRPQRWENVEHFLVGYNRDRCLKFMSMESKDDKETA